MAWKFDKAEMIKANLPEYREPFQTLLELMLAHDLNGFRKLTQSMDSDTKNLVSKCMGKDGNTLVHRLCQGVCGENTTQYLDALLPDDNNDILDYPNKLGLFPIHIVVKDNSYSDLLQYLISHKVNLDQGTITHKRTAMMLAAEFVDFELLSTLAESGASLIAKDSAGKTFNDELMLHATEDEAKEFAAFAIYLDGLKQGLIVKRDVTKRSRRAL